ncbi:MAG: ATP-binding protein [Clostridium sp.]|uniref:ATP-binding protein n=1 Tax=Clostridium sp. TaxID=1506 RepID=UPI00290A8AA0|nr:ATP-binding protein [Clostridium sp.]MDU5109459.1 ATP-binding protein [Clostridium sp.]
MISIFKKFKFFETNKITYPILTIICTLAVILSFLSISNVGQIKRITDEIYESPYELSYAEWSVRWRISSISHYMRQITNKYDSTPINDIEDEISDVYNNMEVYYSIIYNKYNGPEKEIFINKIYEMGIKQNEIIKIAESGDLDTARQIYEEEYLSIVNSLDIILNEMINSTSKSASDIVSEGRGTYSFKSMFAIAISIAISIISILFAFIASKRRRNDVFSREVLFNMLTENIDDVYLMYNLKNKKIEFVSSNVERKFGVEIEELLNDYNVLKGYMDNEVIDSIRRLYKSPQIKMTEWKSEVKNRRNQKVGWVNIRIYPVIQDGELTRYVINFADITEILNSQRDLKDALTSAENANNSKRNFLSRMSHEIRTPINAIIGMTDIASSNLGDHDRLRDCLKKIETSSKFLLRIINDILDMSKIESGKTKISFEAFTLKEFTSNIESIIKPQAKLKDIKFDIIFQGIKNNNIVGDQLRVNQILINILSNAVKFTSNGGEITLTIKEIERKGKLRICFIIKDNGIGMDEEELERIFRPFEQANMDTSIKHGGTGLGLSITKNLVELMNGSINVSSIKGEGSQFTVEIPFEVNKNNIDDNSYIEIESDRFRVEDQNKEVNYDFSGKRFLIVEDNELNLEIASEILKFKGANIETAENGQIAFEKFENSSPGYYDAILMDIRMPVLNGYEATKKIRRSGHLDSKEISIIAMTANAFSEDVSKAMECGMNAHIAKPIDKEILYSTLNEYVI